jgi:hypothetical protein
MKRSQIQTLAFVTCFALIGCGSEVERKITPIEPSFSVSAPQDSSELLFSVTDSVDDSGAHRISISGELVNSAGSTGQTWSDLFDQKFVLNVGSAHFTYAVQSDAKKFLLSDQPINVNAVSEAFAKTITIASGEGVVLSSEALMLPALSDVVTAEPALASRVLSTCKFQTTDPFPSLIWEGRSGQFLEVTVGSKSEFATTILDSGTWSPSANLFSKFFTSQDIASADLVGAPTSKIVLPLHLKRTTQQAVRVVKPGGLDRSLTISLSVEEQKNINVRYVGACSQ